MDGSASLSGCCTIPVSSPRVYGWLTPNQTLTPNMHSLPHAYMDGSVRKRSGLRLQRSSPRVYGWLYIRRVSLKQDLVFPTRIWMARARYQREHSPWSLPHAYMDGSGSAMVAPGCRVSSPRVYGWLPAFLGAPHLLQVFPTRIWMAPASRTD